MNFAPSSRYTERMSSLTLGLIGYYGHSFAYIASWRDIEIHPMTRSRLNLDGGCSVLSSLRHTYIKDNRDRPDIPETGHAIKIVNDVGIFGGTARFWKTVLSLQSNFRLATNWSLSLFSKFGVLLPFTNPAGKQSGGFISDRFFLGGPYHVRGYDMRRIGPSDNGDYLGAEMSFNASAHIHFPLPILFPSIIRGHIFGTIGNAANLQSNVSESVSHLMSNLKAAVGVGIVFGLGPFRIELNLINPIGDAEGRCKSRWQLAFGEFL